MVTNWDTVPVLMDTIMVSDILGLNDDTIRRKIRKGEIPAANLGTEKMPEYRIAKEDLREYLNSKKR